MPNTTEKIPYSKLSQIMSEYNRRFPDKQDTPSISGVIVFKQSNWPDHLYSEKSRSYRVYNSNRTFQDGKIANSLFGSCLDGSDQGVRLDWYKWEVEYCYMD